MGNHDEHGHDDHGHDDHGRSFDERARDWDDEIHVERGRRTAAAIREAIAPDATTRVLEYGAGTGLTTQFLAAGPLGPATLADPSAGMREVMAEKVADGRLPADARITDLDLASDWASGELSDERFDLIAMVMTLHHVPDPAPVLAASAQLLSSGGHLCIADLDAEDGSFHADTGLDVHDGFERDELSGWLKEAGFSDVTFGDIGEVVRHDRAYPLFLAVARR